MSTGTTPIEYAPWCATTLGAVTERLEHAAVLELAGPLGGRDVLDVGCGDGAYALAAARAGGHVTGLDRSAAAVDAARRKVEAQGLVVDLRIGDATALPFPADRFDVVLAVTVLCFVEQPPQAVAEMARVLRPGGVLVLGELGRWSTWAATPGPCCGPTGSCSPRSRRSPSDGSRADLRARSPENRTLLGSAAGPPSACSLASGRALAALNMAACRCRML